MDTRSSLVAAALKVLEETGESQFSTRAVCTLAKVSAPTLYHHFGSADGLLSAAITEAFAQFLVSKTAGPEAVDAVDTLRQGWDNYVRFAADRPRLYAAMVARVLQGATIPAADEARADLLRRISAVDAEGRLAMAPTDAADLAWASAHAASMLYVTSHPRTPDPVVVNGLRDDALRTICTSRPKGKRS